MKLTYLACLLEVSLHCVVLEKEGSLDTLAALQFDKDVGPLFRVLGW